jgi:hypothetical protein
MFRASWQPGFYIDGADGRQRTVLLLRLHLMKTTLLPSLLWQLRQQRMTRDGKTAASLKLVHIRDIIRHDKSNLQQPAGVLYKLVCG